MQQNNKGEKMPKTYHKNTTIRKPMFYGGTATTQPVKQGVAIGGMTPNMPNVMGQSMAQGMPQDKFRKNAPHMMRRGGKVNKRNRSTY